MKNIHLIPTDKPSRLFLNKVNKKLLLDDILNPNLKKVLPSGSYQHIYITSDEFIEEDDFGLNLSTKEIVQYDGIKGLDSYYKKIILTTDPQLIEDGVQEIDKTFLEWFVKNPSCESVKITKDKIRQDKEFNDVSHWNIYKYKIIIPQEPKQEWNPTQGEEVWMKVFSNWLKGTYIGYDVVKQTHIVREEEKGGGNLFSSTEVLPYTEAAKKEERIFNVSMMKQETTLEEAALKLYPKLISDPYNPAEDLMAEERNIFIAGAKWQAEKSYTKEEVIAFAKWMYDYKADINRVEEWLEQFKK